MKMFVKNSDLKIGGQQDYSAVAEISFSGGELNRVSENNWRTFLTGIKVTFEIKVFFDRSSTLSLCLSFLRFITSILDDFLIE